MSVNDRVVSDQEVEETLRQSRELLAKSEALIAEVLDPDKQIGPLLEVAGKEFERMIELVNTPGAPPGTGMDCLATTFELFGDWAEYEVVDRELGDKKPDKPAAPGRPPMRRGMRI
jgi:hypothetical protein